MYEIANFIMRVQIPLLSFYKRGMTEWPIVIDCKSIRNFFRRFESYFLYNFFKIFMRTFLSKLKSESKNKKFLTFYCNFETIIIDNAHYVTCYSITGNNMCKSSVINIDHSDQLISNSDLLVNEFLSECINICKSSSKKVKTIFFFHSLNKFDSFFLLKNLTSVYNFNIKLITRNNSVYKIIAENETLNFKLEFRDSFLLLPISLEEISNVFCINNKKYVFELSNKIESYTDDQTFKQELVDFCISNSKILQEGFEKFLWYIRDVLVLEPLNCLSLPGLALRYFRLNYYDSENTPIERLSENKDSFIRKSYRGGIVEVFKPHLIDGFHYDVNSLYPYVMKTFPMPVGIGKWVNNIDITTFFGFVKVEVTCPETLEKPFLNFYDSKLGLISPTGTWVETYFSEEIKHALTLGYKFKYINGISYEKGIVFNDFIDKIYKIRLNTEKNSPLNTLMKLLMNSLYGRFGMQTSMIQSKIINPIELQNYISLYDVKDISEIGEKLLISFEPKILINKLDTLLTNNIIDISQYSKLPSFSSSINESSAVQIASAITAYARIFMDNFKQNTYLDVYYSDTDSIYCKNALNSNYVSSINLGSFKLENKLDEALFVAPKIYMLKTAKKETILKCKGLSSSLLTENDLRDIYNESSNVIKKVVTYFRRDFKNLSVLEKEHFLNISAKLLKRKKIFKNKIWTDTAPLKIKK